MSEILIIETRVKRLHNLEHCSFHSEFNAVFKKADDGVHHSALNVIAKRFNTIVARRDKAGKNSGGGVSGEVGGGGDSGDETGEMEE